MLGVNVDDGVDSVLIPILILVVSRMNVLVENAGLERRLRREILAVETRTSYQWACRKT